MPEVAWDQWRIVDMKTVTWNQIGISYRKAKYRRAEAREKKWDRQKQPSNRSSILILRFRITIVLTDVENRVKKDRIKCFIKKDIAKLQKNNKKNKLAKVVAVCIGRDNLHGAGE